MTQRYCESCGNLFDAESTSGTTPDGSYLCPNCALKQGSGDAAPPQEGTPMMSKGGGLKKSVDEGAPDKLTFRCPGCNALLSSKKIQKRSRLTCPKCHEKVTIEPDGTASLLTKREPHMKKVEVPKKQKIFSDRDLENLLDFGGKQAPGQATDGEAPTPPPAPAPAPAPAPPAPAGTPGGEEPFAGPQYVSDEEEQRLAFLDQVQGPGGKRKPTSGPKTLDSEIPATGKKAPTGIKKRTRFSPDRHKTESVEDRLAAAKTKRAAVRNKVLAIAFIVLPLLVGVIAYYSASRPVKADEEGSGFAKLVKSIGAKASSGALAVYQKIDKDFEVPKEKTAPEEQSEQTEQPEQPAGETKPPEEPEQPAGETKPPEEPEKPAGETKPPEEPEQPAGETKPPEEPEKPAGETKPPEEPEKPAGETKPPEEPEKPAGETKPPEKPAEKPEPEKEKVETIKCPNCGKTILKSATKCPWCGHER